MGERNVAAADDDGAEGEDEVSEEDAVAAAPPRRGPAGRFRKRHNAGPPQRPAGGAEDLASRVATYHRDSPPLCSVPPRSTCVSASLQAL